MTRYGVRIHVILPEEFLRDLDEEARIRLLSRSDFVRLALLEKMKRQSLTSPSQLIIPPPPFDPLDFSEFEE